MQFSDTTNKTGILQRCELYNGLPDGAITGDTTLKAYFTGLVNEAYYDVVMEILRSQDAWDFDDSNRTNFPVATTPLVASQRDYAFDAALGILKMKRVDITYDGTNYYPATPVDSSEFLFGVGNETLIDNNFSKTAPAYDLKANSMLVYPLPSAADVAAGGLIRIELVRKLDDFATSDTTQEPGIDRPWHDLIPLGASMKYSVIRNMENAKNLKTLYDEGLEKLRVYYSRKQLDRQPVMVPQVSIDDYS